jgi:GAF domain-containing protein
MAEELHIAKGGKEQKYELLYRQVVAMLDNERDVVANMANLAAMIHQTFGFWWTGFYRVVGQELVLGPFQGPIACTRIAYGRGVCGTAWQRGESVVVEDVEKFPGHIACSSLSRSEIVVPVFKGKNSEVSDGSANDVAAVLDIDSKELSTFNDVDAKYLEELSSMITSLLFR